MGNTNKHMKNTALHSLGKFSCEISFYMYKNAYNKKVINKWCWRCRDTGTPLNRCWECKMAYYWKTVRHFLKNLNINLSNNQTFPLLGIHPKEMKTHVHKKDWQVMFIAAMFIAALCILVKKEATQMSINYLKDR